MKQHQSSADSESRASAHQASQQATAQFAAVVQMDITDEVTVNVANIAQSDTNLCWAAAGWCIHRAKGGTAYGSERDFVDGQKGAQLTLTRYDNNRVNDIDNIIGSNSVTNHLVGSDVVDPFAKSAISRALNNGNPILANVNNNHYVVICGKRKKDGDYQLRIMDPATGGKSWKDAYDNANNMRVSRVGNYALSVLYYT